MKSNNYYIDKVVQIVDDFKFDRITAEEGVSAMEAVVYLTQHDDVDIILLINSVCEMFKMISNEV